MYTNSPRTSLYCDSANSTPSDLKSAAYPNNGSFGTYLSIVAPKISISFCFNEKIISTDCKKQSLMLQHDYFQGKLNTIFVQ